MTYEPITEEKREQWINWLEEKADDLNGTKQEIPSRDIFDTEEGDLETCKDLVGNLLATLKQQPITIL